MTAVKAGFPTLIHCAPLARSGSDALSRELSREAARIRRHDRAGRHGSQRHCPGG